MISENPPFYQINSENSINYHTEYEQEISYVEAQTGLVNIQQESISGEECRKGKHAACAHCKKAHLSCDFNRPCGRCTHSGRDCIDADHKPRGRPRMKERTNFEAKSSLIRKRPSTSSSQSISDHYIDQNTLQSTPFSFSGGLVGNYSDYNSSSSSNYDPREYSFENEVLKNEDQTTSVQLMNVYLNVNRQISKYPPQFAALFSFSIMNVNLCELVFLTSDQRWLTSSISGIIQQPYSQHYGRIHLNCNTSIIKYDVCIRAVGVIEEKDGYPIENSYIVISFGRGIEVSSEAY